MILAALLLSSFLTACGGTTPSETDGSTTAVETKAPETDPVATDAPTPESSYDTSLVTENGIAKAHVVVAENATPT